MALSEFSLIEQYFARLTTGRDDVTLGIGDDCAILRCPAGKELAVSIDTLVDGVHFFSDVSPEALGYKSLAVSLSDLAAMGAEPAWFTLALTLPEVNESWLQAFAKGLAGLASQHNIQLVGGDTTRGPLTISIQAHGLVDEGRALRRDGAKVGDRIYVSGCLGDAGAALRHRLEDWTPAELKQADWAYLRQRLEYPGPRNALAGIIKPYASAAIDISDGLLADLGYILKRSGKGARVRLAQLPLSDTLRKISPQSARELALSSGDDYELCFTVPETWVAELETDTDSITCIGEITQGDALLLEDESGQTTTIKSGTGYDHFGT